MGKLVHKFEEEDRVVALEDFMSDSKGHLLIKKGHEGVIREVDDHGDISVRFDGLEKRQWIFVRHAHRIGLSDGKGDSLACAVTLLCDDAGGPPLCAASARSMLMKLADEVGMNSLMRQPQDENLALKA